MDIKKTPKSTASASAAPSSINKLYHFVGNVKEEFRKITWTSKEELRTYTKAVVGATFALGFAVYFTDLIIQMALWTIDKGVRLFFG